MIVPDQAQTYHGPYDLALAGLGAGHDFALPEPSTDIVRRIVALRAADELIDGATVNFGFGMSAGVAEVIVRRGAGRALLVHHRAGHPWRPVADRRPVRHRRQPACHPLLRSSSTSIPAAASTRPFSASPRWTGTAMSMSRISAARSAAPAASSTSRRARARSCSAAVRRQGRRACRCAEGMLGVERHGEVAQAGPPMCPASPSPGRRPRARAGGRLCHRAGGVPA